MRLRLVPDETNIDFFRYARATFGASVVAFIASIAIYLVMGLNYGIDFTGGTAIRTESPAPVDVGAYRAALEPLGLGDVVISEVYDPTFGPEENVASVRVQNQGDEGSISAATLAGIEEALTSVDPGLEITSTESVSGKVSGELVWTAILAVAGSVAAIMIYIWLRFEWQFSVGAIVALVHDVGLTIGIFSLFQIRFDLAIIAALLTIVGYSINDTVVVFDRARENLRKYKTKPLIDVLNLSANETLSRTVMTTGTTLLALIALLILGGDVLRAFVFAITWGIVVGTYSSIYVAKNVVLMLGVTRDWDKNDRPKGNQFADMDA